MRVRIILLLLIGMLLGACAGPAPSDAPPAIGTPLPTSPPEPSAAASPTPQSTSAPEGPSGSPEPGDALLVTCDSPPFGVEVFDRQPVDELEDHPSAAALRAALAGGRLGELRASSWWRVARDASTAAYLQGPGPVYQYVLVETDGSRWSWNGRMGECTLTPDLDRHNPVTWTLDPAAPAPRASSTRLVLLVTEVACTNGGPVRDRLLGPAIVYEHAGVFITFASVPTPGDGQECEAPPSRVTVKLREPLGNRTLRGWEPPSGTGG